MLLNILFFSYTVVEGKKLDLDIRKFKSYTIFRNALLKTSRPNQTSVYRIHNAIELKLLTRLRVDFSHLNEHSHNFFTVLPLFFKYSFNSLKQYK